MQAILDLVPIWAIAIVGVLIVLVGLRLAFGGRKSKAASKSVDLFENLAEYPLPPAGELTCRLMVDKMPVRLRFVALAPVGDVEVNLEDAEAILDRLCPNLGLVAQQDRPRIRLWPRQVSSSGFAQQFFTSVITPEEDAPTWMLTAGRAKIGKRTLMIGLASQSKTPVPFAQKTLDVNDWPSLLHVRVKG